MFADDTTLSAVFPNSKSRTAVNHSLQSDLDNITLWAEKWLVNFNAKKTQLMTVSRKKDKATLPNLCFLDETLREVNIIKLVGIIITDKLNWGDHVDKLAKRAGQHLGIIRKAKHILPPTALASLYKTKVRSVMEYCSPIWQSASSTVLAKLDANQRKAIRCMGAVGDVIPIHNIYHLSERREVSGCSQFYRMFHDIAPQGICKLLPPLLGFRRNSRSVSSNHHLQLLVKRSHTQHHMSSFVPTFTRLWNSLPNEVMYSNNGEVRCLEAFKSHVNKFLLASR